MVLLLSTAVFSITRSLEAEPLLACVTAGMVLANRRCVLGGSSYSDNALKVCKKRLLSTASACACHVCT